MTEGSVRHPLATFDSGGLADVQRRDPLHDLLGLVGLLQHPASLPRSTTTVARRSHRDMAKLIRVLKATLKGPQRSSQRPT